MTTSFRVVRDLAPIVLAANSEIRLELRQYGPTQWLAMTTWHETDGEWVRLPGSTNVPVHLLGQLRNRFTAAAA